MPVLVAIFKCRRNLARSGLAAETANDTWLYGWFGCVGRRPLHIVNSKSKFWVWPARIGKFSRGLLTMPDSNKAKLNDRQSYFTLLSLNINNTAGIPLSSASSLRTQAPCCKFTFMLQVKHVTPRGCPHNDLQSYGSRRHVFDLKHECKLTTWRLSSKRRVRHSQ